jgi:hypothetical protein
MLGMKGTKYVSPRPVWHQSSAQDLATLVSPPGDPLRTLLHTWPPGRVGNRTLRLATAWSRTRQEIGPQRSATFRRASAQMQANRRPKLTGVLIPPAS